MRLPSAFANMERLTDSLECETYVRQRQSNDKTQCTYPTTGPVECRSLAICGISGTNDPDDQTAKYFNVRQLTAIGPVVHYSHGNVAMSAVTATISHFRPLENLSYIASY